MEKRLVGDWMTRNPVIVLPSTPLPDAYALMQERRVRRLPVMNAGKLVGIITLGDLRQAHATVDDAEAAKMRVELIMTENVVTVTPQTPLRDAAKLMIKHKVSGLPVMDGAELVGIITESDIFRAIMAEDQPVEVGRSEQQAPLLTAKG
ncbi:MAG: CBS domain-containing protein [Chloroflexi bacterium]|jgi:CBS domain-containing protein|uniref:CBS domain-containing protein n=1 Tax=Candidatus Roseilinea sp. NK_OTU-006 TaxID=2704250 RepID=UPI000F0FD025|nr:CBS domain-containing protein [Candidatus Roseilinea sp. NK_OTU-006]RMG64464.1 MAG: CBS domain-containing protein [Chloroflexota bacterium]